jgi:tryptophanyl-tRNA synthetase
MNGKIKKKKIFVTGIQPTGDGNLHIGNYCGCIYNIKKLIEDKDNLDDIEVYIFIADLHSMTIFSKNLKQKNLILFKNLYAFFKNTNVHIYIQSEIKGITEGLWLLSMFTTTGEMNRMTQFKDKKELNNNNIGLYTYPILMAADVLLMKANYVPVGDDQTQHLEVIKNIGKRINRELPNIFPIPDNYELYNNKNSRIMSLNNINKKMSKSIPEGCIFFNDSNEKIIEKIKKAQTDEFLFPSTLENLLSRPTAYNLSNILSMITDRPLEEIVNEYKGFQWKNFKEILIEKIIEFTDNFKKNYNNISENEIEKILLFNHEKVNNIVSENLKDLYKIYM